MARTDLATNGELPMLHAVPPTTPATSAGASQPKPIEEAKVSSRDKKVHLTQPQMKALAEFVINKQNGVIMNNFEEFVRFRVSKIDLANEAHNHFKTSIGPHQVDKAVKWYIEMLKEFKTPVNLTALPPKATVEDDKNKIEIIKLKAEIDKFKVELDKAKMHIEKQSKSLDELREKMKKAYEMLRPGVV